MPQEVEPDFVVLSREMGPHIVGRTKCVEAAVLGPEPIGKVDLASGFGCARLAVHQRVGQYEKAVGTQGAKAADVSGVAGDLCAGHCSRLTTLLCLSQYCARVRHHVARYLVVLVVVLAGCSASVAVVDPLYEADDGAVSAGADGELSSEDVYEKIQDSIVYIEAPNGDSSGSGVVIDGGWIVTNAHVVDRFERVVVGRSDGTDLGEHTVHGVDWIFDLALIGPIDDPSLVPMERAESATLALGDRVLLVGFPDEDTVAPTPTLTEGIVSRRRYVALGDFPFLQVDATIAPGQSGGAMVDGNGRLVGISGLEFGQGEFGLVFESDPMWPRIDALIAQGSTPLPSGTASNTLTDEIGPLRSLGFVVEVDETGMINMSVRSDDDIYVDVQTLGGVTVNNVTLSPDPFRESNIEERLYVDEAVEGGEDVIAEMDPGLYQVVVGSFGAGPAQVEVMSTSAMWPFEDPEENAELPVGSVVEGSIDWSRDSDRWTLTLEAGQQVEIIADGIADTVIAVRLDGDAIVASDDEGLGLFGTGSQVSFTAEVAGAYTVEIGSFDNERWGYLIQATVS